MRDAIADLLSCAGQVSVLQESWQEVRPLLSKESRWRLNRDLALLALASYRSQREQEQELTVAPPDAEIDDDA